MLLVAMLAMVLVAAAPALAQVSQEQSQRRITSGKASPSVGISNKGTNVNQCITSMQSVQTGNVANTQGVVQYAGTVDDVDIEGSAILETPDTSVNCTQLIEQAAAASKGEAKAGSAEAKAAPAQAKAGGAEAKALPPTGGVAGSTASLLGLGAGALLVAGGLLARRIFR